GVRPVHNRRNKDPQSAMDMREPTMRARKLIRHLLVALLGALRTYGAFTSVSQRSQERSQILLLFLGQLQLEEQVEELHGIFERGQPAVMEVRRRILDPAQGEGLDPALSTAVTAVFDAQVVHEVVRVEWRRMTGGTLGFAVEQGLATQLGSGCLAREQLAKA